MQANIRAMLHGTGDADESSIQQHEVINVACGDQVTLNEMVGMLQDITGKDIHAHYGPERPGDVRHSRAQISKAKQLFSYDPRFRFQEGLKIVYEWYCAQNQFPT